jgi:hypothetical protein
VHPLVELGYAAEFLHKFFLERLAVVEAEEIILQVGTQVA